VGDSSDLKVVVLNEVQRNDQTNSNSVIGGATLLRAAPEPSLVVRTARQSNPPYAISLEMLSVVP